MTATPEARSDSVSAEHDVTTLAEQIRGQILAQPDLKTVKLNVSDWPDVTDQLYVRKMKAKERSMFEKSMNFDSQSNPRNIDNLQTRLAILTLVTAAGDRIFQESDLEVLSDKSALAMQEIFNAAAELNGLTAESAEAIAKN